MPPLDTAEIERVATRIRDKLQGEDELVAVASLMRVIECLLGLKNLPSNREN